MMLPKRDWTEMTWEDLAGADTVRWIAVLPVAAIEQHGPHLPLGVDTLIARAYLERVRNRLAGDLPVTFLPLQAVGKSDEHQAFPGTLTLSAETMWRMLVELGESVQRAGVDKLVIVNSHGGNVAPIDIAALELRRRLGMLVVVTAWSRLGYPDGLFSAQEIAHGIHAGEIETSIMLAAFPALVRERHLRNFSPATLAMEEEFRYLRASRPAGFGWMSQDLHAAGAMGNAIAATAEKGEAALAHGADAFVELLREVDRFDVSRLGRGPRR